MNGNKEAVLELLKNYDTEYELLEHDPMYTVEDIVRADLWKHENGIGAKNLFLRDGSGKHHFLIVVREDKQVDLKQMRNEIHSSRLSFASEERLKKYLGVSAGSVSPFGILNDEAREVAVFFDADLKKYEYLAVHPNDNRATVWIKTKVMIRIIEDHGNPFSWITVEQENKE